MTPLKRIQFSGFVTPILLLAYGLITLITPRLHAVDSAGPKFFTLGLLNLAVLIFFAVRKDKGAKSDFLNVFFSNRIGLVYGLFMAISLLTCFKAWNQAEFVLAFVKFFTVFNSVVIVASLFRQDPGKLYLLAAVMSLLLLFDAVMVFFEIRKLSVEHPDFFSLYQYYVNSVSAGYSNKNILASALFIKIPFTLWLITFKKRWIRFLALLVIFVAIIALALLGARAFYIGILIVIVAYLLFLLLRLITKRIKWRTAVVGSSILMAALIIFFTGWLVLGKFFPGVSRFNLKEQIVARLATIRTDISSGTRIASWARSAMLIREEPLMGVGLGNWKVRVLKDENRVTPTYAYYYHNHNDFIEMTAQTGITGGVIYLVLILLPGVVFARSLFKGEGEAFSNRLLFLPAFGMLCYSVDAFFNFPHDRPEIQSLWILFMGSAIAFTPAGKWSQRLTSLFHRLPVNTLLHKNVSIPLPLPARFRKRAIDFSPKHGFILLWFLLIIASLWILYRNIKSLQLQSLYMFEVSNKELKTPATVFLNGFPAIPTISVEGEPIAVIKARYLISENDFTGAIGILQPDQSSPWDTRREFLLSQAFQLTKNDDEAIRYAKVVFAIKPFFKDNLNNLLHMLESREQYEEAVVLIDQYCAALDSLGPGLENYMKVNGDDRPVYLQKQAELKHKAALKQADPEYTLAGYYLQQGDLRKYALYRDRAIKKVPELADKTGR